MMSTGRARMTLLGGGVLLFAAAFLVLRQTVATPASTPATKSAPAARTADQPEQKSTKPSVRPRMEAGDGSPRLPQPVESPHPPGSAENGEWVETRVAELEKLAWFDDATSLHRILAELANPLPEIRTAALAAAKSFGSRDAIPYLETAAARTRDPGELEALNEVIDWLKLPTMVEHLKSQPTPAENAAPAPSPDDGEPSDR